MILTAEDRRMLGEVKAKKRRERQKGVQISG